MGVNEQGQFGNIEKQHLLLVEDDRMEGFFKAVLAHWNWIDVTDIWKIGGADGFEKNLAFIASKEIKNFKELKSIGIIQDAGVNPRETFRRIKHALESNHLNAPDEQGQNSAGSPIIRVILLPSNNGGITLESLCLEALQDDPLLPCVNTYFDCLSNKGVSIEELGDRAKVDVYLASSSPVRSLGGLVEAGVLSLESQIFEKLKLDLTGICNI